MLSPPINNSIDGAVEEEKKRWRDINDILNFRTDISPFLVHLTRDNDKKRAKGVLEDIINNKKLICSDNAKISFARFGMDERKLNDKQKKNLFSAICFTETPLNEIHCLLEVAREVDLKPYGLVFLKKRLIEKDVSPVFYISHKEAGRSKVLEALCRLSCYEEANLILPLVSVFGIKVTSPNAKEIQTDPIDFSWEREWRRPYAYSNLDFTEDDVFIGLCPDDEITEFEKKFADFKFVDPIMNMKFYATKLVEARKRLKLERSVV